MTKSIWRTLVDQVKCTDSAFVIDSVILMILMTLGDSDESGELGEMPCL